MSKRRIEELVAEIAPRPDVAATLRKLPERRAAPPTPPAGTERVAALAQLRPDGVVAKAVVPSAVIEPLAPARYKVQFTASAELQAKLERLRALMRPQVPDGDLAALIEQAVTEKLERLEAQRFARTKAPRKGLRETSLAPSSRHVPAAVRRAVYERDGGRCRYVDDTGRRCPERNRLEYHHLHPFGYGGDHNPQNIHLACPSHNAYLAEADYGRATMARYRPHPSSGRSKERAP